MQRQRFEVRNVTVIVEEIYHDGGPRGRPVRRAAALALLHNPFAGEYVEDIADAMEELKPVGADLASRLVKELGGPDNVQGYGKGAIVGEDGELEHGALWHVPGGYAMREALGNALAIVPSSKKVGGPGTRLDVPLTHRDAAYVRSHFDAMEIGIPSGPTRSEVLVALVMSDGPRIHARVGGLKAEDISAMDGLR